MLAWDSSSSKSQQGECCLGIPPLLSASKVILGVGASEPWFPGDGFKEIHSECYRGGFDHGNNNGKLAFMYTEFAISNALSKHKMILHIESESRILPS